uniref:Uncharacterized protein n=1 Tax=Timema tahoe TaxID=61484 RepID=A0A7R9IGR0_9NEOP|nr:unnamed protein product [Timema tahoe]
MTLQPIFSLHQMDTVGRRKMENVVNLEAFSFLLLKFLRSTNADSPPLRAHPDLVLEFKYCEKFVQRGHARSFGQPRTDISVILQKCCSELDVSIVDRITALLNPQPLCKRNPNKFSGDKHSMSKCIPGSTIFFTKNILVLFHSNAAVERSFSVNKECLVENLHEDILIAQRVTYDAVTAAGGLLNMTISKKMIHAVRNASGIRKEALEKKKKIEVDLSQKKKIII